MRFGLPLGDVADAIVIRLADAASELDGLENPPEGGVGLSRFQAIEELRKRGFPEAIVSALASTSPVSDGYLSAWRLHPEFAWRPKIRTAFRSA